MDQITQKVLYTGHTHTTGGRSGGASRSDDGRLDIRFAVPGSAAPGTNPEQLLAAGWSACFIGALGGVARRKNIALPADLTVDAEIDLCLAGDAYSLQARLRVGLPGLPVDVARELADAAHDTCPYSKALTGNIPIAISVV